MNACLPGITSNVRLQCLTIGMSDLSGSRKALEMRDVAALVRRLAAWDVSELTRDEFLALMDAAGELDRCNGAFQSKMAGDLQRRSPGGPPISAQ